MIWMAAFVVLKIGKRVGNWYRFAAERGQGLAQFKLGVMYDNGEGVPEDDKQAVKWYRLAAEQGQASDVLVEAICQRKNRT